MGTLGRRWRRRRQALYRGVLQRRVGSLVKGQNHQRDHRKFLEFSDCPGSTEISVWDSDRTDLFFLLSDPQDQTREICRTGPNQICHIPSSVLGPSIKSPIIGPRLDQELAGMDVN